LSRALGGIDPQIAGRLARAQGILAGDYVDTLQRRNALLPAMDRRLADIDVLAMPTTPIVAPTIAEVAVDEAFGRRNAQLLRNPSIANFFNLCSISLPLPRAGGLPVGLMLMARHGHDHRLFRIAAAIEQALAT
jgi:aspartyl-tRNA(Asn)/glutamyl-tRNA(Gln) amidotransferase subunit A